MRELEEYLESSPPESPPEKRRHVQERSLSPVQQVRSTSPVRSCTPPSRSRSPTRSRSPSQYASRSPVRSPTRLSRRPRSPMRSREGNVFISFHKIRVLVEELADPSQTQTIVCLRSNKQ